jgi:hypothetical protein
VMQWPKNASTAASVMPNVRGPIPMCGLMITLPLGVSRLSNGRDSAADQDDRGAPQARSCPLGPAAAIA